MGFRQPGLYQAIMMPPLNEAKLVIWRWIIRLGAVELYCWIYSYDNCKAAVGHSSISGRARLAV